MADYNELTYKNVAMGVATVALTTSNLDASVVSFNFGASGVEVPHSTSTQTENNGTQQFFAFGYLHWTLLVITQHNYYHNTFLDYE